MTTTQALVIEGAGRLRLLEQQLPTNAPSDALVDIAYGGICGSDLHYLKDGTSGSSVLRAPMVLGHEVVGVIRTAAADGRGPSAGTPVAIHPARTCGTCDQCRSGRRNLCSRTRYLGSAAFLPHCDGGFATTISVPSPNLRALPTDQPLSRFAMVEPASVAWHAVNRVPSVDQQRVLVVGAGPIGLALVAVLKLRGARAIAVSDLHERPLFVARTLGATQTIDPRQPVVDRPDLFDVAFECSGSAAGLGAAIESTQPGGDVVMVGNQRVGDTPFAAARAISKELRVSGSYRFDQEFDAVIAAISGGLLDLTPVVTDVFDYQQFDRAFEVAADPVRSSKVLLSFIPRTTGRGRRE